MRMNRIFDFTSQRKIKRTCNLTMAITLILRLDLHDTEHHLLDLHRNYLDSHLLLKMNCCPL